MNHSTDARREMSSWRAARSRVSTLLACRYAAALLALGGTMAAPALLAQGSSFNDIGAGLPGVHHGSAIWGDYYDDQPVINFDFFLNGQKLNPLGLYTDIWHNTFYGNFAALGSGIPAIGGTSGRSRSAWGDYDSDGDIDLIVTGSSASGFVANIYRNDGGTFAQETIKPGPLPGVWGSGVAWGDYDNDGDLDLLVSSYLPLRVYRNDGPDAGGWKFTALTLSTRPRGNGDCAWGDYDNDGDLDIVVSGYASNISLPSTTILQNNGNAFTAPSGIGSLTDLGYSSVAWGDYNNDGYLDLAISGIDASNIKRLLIYRNNSGASFTQATSLNGVANGSLAWGDYDNDGNLDLLVTGIDNPSGLPDNPTATVYAGDGSGGFAEDNDAHLTGIFESQASWGDYDFDGRLDILAAGNDGTTAISTVYQNVTPGMPGGENQLPAIPGTPVLTASWKSITATWPASTDALTPSAGLSYSLRVRDAVTNQLVKSAMVEESGSGYHRQVPQIGNVNQNLTWTITGLQPNHAYEVCVQTVDGAFAASGLVCETITTASTGPDVMIRDCISDVGSEPDNQCNVLCYSPDIYIRNQQDGLLPGRDIHQTPIPGQTNWVYVKLKNIGGGTLPQGTVYTYWTKAATTTDWPVNWVNYYRNGVLHGDMIGSASVTSLASSGSTIVEMPWTTVPDPASFNDPDARHFCLIARLVAPSDPMATPEGTSIADNARNNNNIAWKNVTIYTPGDPSAPVGVANNSGAGTATRLQFTDTDPEVEVPLVELVTIKVDLGRDLFDLWNQGGRVAEGVEVVSEDPENTSIYIISDNAQIGGILLPAEFYTTIRVEFIYPEEIPANASPVYHWLIDQYQEDGNVYIGGEMYDVVTTEDEAGGKRAFDGQNDLAATLGLVARPNPTTGATMLTYTLPAETRVTLAIHDANGRLVRTLLDGTEQSAGSHEILWNGETSGGVPVVSGTYFYRMETPRGTVEKRIVIVR